MDAQCSRPLKQVEGVGWVESEESEMVGGKGVEGTPALVCFGLNACHNYGI